MRAAGIIRRVKAFLVWGGMGALLAYLFISGIRQ